VAPPGRIQGHGLAVFSEEARCGRSRRRNPVSRRLPLVCAIGVLGSLAAAPTGARATTRFVVTNLVTDDQTANPAKITDTELVNAWGVSYAGSGPFWVSANKTGKSTLYAVAPSTNATSKLGLTVAIPGDGRVTGQASSFGTNTFVFASEDGTVSGWAAGVTAVVLQAASTSNVYKGAAVGTIDTNTYLYLANFRAGTIDVIKANAAEPDLAGTFTDPDLPAGYAPFNVANLGDTLYVSYAVQDQDKMNDVAGAGHGIVDQFDLQGNLVRRLTTGGTLDSPWGLAIAPPSFDSYAGDLLVGNFVDGTVNAFDLASGDFVSQLADTNGVPIAIDGLWALIPGNDGLAGSSDAIYFAAGPASESHGLLGVILPAPEPARARIELAALAALVGLRCRLGVRAQRTRTS